MYKVLLVEAIDDAGINLLREHFQVEIAPNPQESTIVSMIPEYDALVIRATKLTESILAAGKKLKIVSRHGVGMDNLNIPASTAHGVILSTTPGANSHSVAEHTVGAICWFLKQYGPAERLLREGKFNQAGSLTGLLTKLGFENAVLEGKTLALVGVGAISRHVAKLCGPDGFGMNIIAYSPHVSAEQMEALHIKKCETLEEMLPVCDVLSIHTPKRPDTVNLINRDSFAKMKPTAILINTARGGIVNEADLAEALKNHQIAGAALDVFDPEPPALDNPLFQLDNVLLTPHIGAATDGAMQNMARACAQNIIDYFGGKRPGFVVNPEIYIPISENPKA